MDVACRQLLDNCGKVEGATFPELAVRGQFAPHRLSKLTADRQAEPGACVTWCQVALGKGFKDSIEVSALNTST